MSLYVEIASKQHLTPIAALATFSNDCSLVPSQPRWASLLLVHVYVAPLLIAMYFYILLYIAFYCFVLAAAKLRHFMSSHRCVLALSFCSLVTSRMLTGQQPPNQRLKKRVMSLKKRPQAAVREQAVAAADYVITFTMALEKL